MNNIPEIPNGDLNGIKTTTNGTSTNITQSSSTSTYATNGQTHVNSGSDDVSSASVNGNGFMPDELKIISHMKDFKVINESRRLFLNNTLSETSTENKFETETTTQTGTSSAANGGSNGQLGSDRVFFNEKRVHLREERLDTLSDLDSVASTSSSKFTTPALLKSPATPPPKPPMLSRTRSVGVGDNRSSPVSAASPPQSPATFRPQEQQRPQSISVLPSQRSHTLPESRDCITTATITTAMVPEPVKITTIQLKEDTPVLRRIETPISVDSENQQPNQQPRQISPKHYEHLIEELKCPGCAYPMKAPILLCKTGHSICEQCTRVLLLCPLCKEPFTNIRSRTVEALCSKAHFRCSNAAGGCTVRLQIDLLGWHEKQCIYKPMKCFMGRVWGDCDWSGREANWKEHLETEHGNKVFTTDTTDLIWNMGIKQKPLTGYYVFQVFGEMFNFYEVYDKDRVLFTMTCTSTVKEKKNMYAFEVTMIHHNNDALAITQKFPVHSEYDRDILLEGTCVSMALNDLAKFIDEERLLHYRVRLLEVKSPRKSRISRNSTPSQGIHPIDFQQTQIEGSNLKNVPNEVIVTRKISDLPFIDSSTTPTSNGGPESSSEEELERIRRQYNRKLVDRQNSESSDSDPELEAFLAKKWGTPQLHFNRKYLKPNSTDSSSNEDDASRKQNGDTLRKMDKKFPADDKISISSTSTSYKKRVTNTLRKSFRSLKTDIIEMKPFGKRSSAEKKS